MLVSSPLALRDLYIPFLISVLSASVSDFSASTILFAFDFFVFACAPYT